MWSEMTDQGQINHWRELNLKPDYTNNHDSYITNNWAL